MTSRGRYFFLALILVLTSARLTAAQSFGNPLTQAQVDCEERQMMRLIHRVSVEYLGSHVFLWRSTPGGGVYRGLAASSFLFGVGQEPSSYSHEEEQLAFDLVLKAEDDFPNPKRLRLPQGTLVRRDAASNLSSLPDREPLLAVTVDLAPEVPDPTMPTAPLRITNRLLLGAGQSDRAGRSLAKDDLFTACHAEVNDFDVKVASILARTVRASACLYYQRYGCPDILFPFKAVIFRGVEPLTYRMNILSYGDTCFDDCFYAEEAIAFLFHLQVDSKGNLTGGGLQVLPWCTTADQINCTNYSNPELAFFVLPPMLPGVDKQGPAEFGRAARVEVNFNGSDENILHADVNWLDLLKDTSWNGGLTPPRNQP